MKNHFIDTDKKPVCPNGWTVEEHKKMGMWEWNPKEVILHLEPEQEKGNLVGNVLRERLKDKPVLNANVLDYLLAHSEFIPEEWKNEYVFFWGTVYRVPGGGLRVRYLRWHGGRWGWDWVWLRADWDERNPAALRASSSVESLSVEVLELKLKVGDKEMIFIPKEE